MERRRKGKGRKGGGREAERRRRGGGRGWDGDLGLNWENARACGRACGRGGMAFWGCSGGTTEAGVGMGLCFGAAVVERQRLEQGWNSVWPFSGG